MNKIAFACAFLFAALSLQVAAFNNQYVATSVVNFHNQYGKGIHADVHYTGTDQYYQKATSPIVQNLNVTILFDADNELTVLIEDADNERFKVPYADPFSYTKTEELDTPNYNVNVTSSPFSIAVSRIDTGEVIFNTANFDFVYSDYYLTFGTSLPSKYLYGLGERRTDFLYNSGLYTIYNKDQYTQIDSGQGNQQTYGTHPMYMMREASGNWHVVYLRNFNPMDFRFDSSNQNIQYYITGSVIELKFFLGDSQPDTVLKQYHNYINGWSLMPFWSHGYHQSKYGVIYFEDLYDVVSNFTAYNIPIDVIWSDIDYMYSFTDFTVDNDRYNNADVMQMAEKIHWVPIVDAGVVINTTAASYIDGMEKNVWIRSANNNSNPLVGVVWPGVVHWVDFWNPNASDYWTSMFQMFHNEDAFSGIWLDMNEYSNFCNGDFPNSCNFLADYLPDAAYPNGDNVIPEGDQDNTLPPSPWAWLSSDSLPYVPGNTPLEVKSLPINALHYGGLIELNVHNLEGFMESHATYKALQSITGERPFILSRSTAVGSGQFVAHWSGDNYASWDFLKYSISCVFNFQLYGVPMTGDDICGFAGETNEELCSRWMQVGAFYPFMRNHMALGVHDHYPYSFGPTLLDASIASLKLRYSILKYYYTLFVANQGTGTVFRPVFFDFNQADDKLLSLDTQFLIGSALMSGAIYQSGQTQLSIYFPTGARWYDFSTGNMVFDASQTSTTEGFDAPLNGTLPVFIRAGYIVPVSNVDNVLNTKEIDNVLNLVAAIAPNGTQGTANGQILGISNYSSDASVDKCVNKINGNDCLITVSLQSSQNTDGSTDVTLSFNGLTASSALEEVYIGNVTIYGVASAQSVACRVNDSPALLTIPSQLSFTIDANGNCGDADQLIVS